jgi:hypothetical protein
MNIASRCSQALHHALAAYCPSAKFDEQGYVTKALPNFGYEPPH